MTENIKRISEFCESWPHLKREEFVALFTEDAVYRNIPFPGDVIGGEGVAVLRALKSELDPAGIMNPGKLLALTPRG